MIRLDLTQEQQETLRQVLEDCLSELQTEIGETDDWNFKRTLKSRLEILSKVVGALQEVPKAIDTAHA